MHVISKVVLGRFFVCLFVPWCHICYVKTSILLAMALLQSLTSLPSHPPTLYSLYIWGLFMMVPSFSLNASWYFLFFCYVVSGDMRYKLFISTIFRAAFSNQAWLLNLNVYSASIHFCAMFSGQVVYAQTINQMWVSKFSGLNFATWFGSQRRFQTTVFDALCLRS